LTLKKVSGTAINKYPTFSIEYIKKYFFFQISLKINRGKVSKMFRAPITYKNTKLIHTQNNFRIDCHVPQTPQCESHASDSFVWFLLESAAGRFKEMQGRLSPFSQMLRVTLPPHQMQLLHLRGCNQKIPDWPPGARTANGAALCH
jgi:hypothetical protein